MDTPWRCSTSPPWRCRWGVIQSSKVPAVRGKLPCCTSLLALPCPPLVVSRSTGQTWCPSQSRSVTVFAPRISGMSSRPSTYWLPSQPWRTSYWPCASPMLSQGVRNASGPLISSPNLASKRVSPTDRHSSRGASSSVWLWHAPWPMIRPCCSPMSPAPAWTQPRHRWCCWPCTASAESVLRPCSLWPMIPRPSQKPIRYWTCGRSTAPLANQTMGSAHESLDYRLEIPVWTSAGECADRCLCGLRRQPDPGYLSPDPWHPCRLHCRHDRLQPDYWRQE